MSFFINFIIGVFVFFAVLAGLAYFFRDKITEKLPEIEEKYGVSLVMVWDDIKDMFKSDADKLKNDAKKAVGLNKRERSKKRNGPEKQSS